VRGNAWLEALAPRNAGAFQYGYHAQRGNQGEYFELGVLLYFC